MAAAAPRATTSVTYVDASGNSQTCSNAELISDNTLNGTDIYRQDITLGSDNTETWYTVSGYNEPNTVTIRGTVNLIIQDDAWLGAYSNVKMLANSGAHLIIWGQSEATGTLQAIRGPYNSSGVEVPEGTSLTINGAKVNVQGGENCAGIGGGRDATGTITINAGTITATGGENGAGIGGSNERISYAGNIIINGGNVDANGGSDAAGIGGGGYSAGGSPYENAGKGPAGGKITINGGTVFATGGGVRSSGFRGGAGIGGGHFGAGGTVVINNGMVTATGGEHSAGIGNGSYDFYDKDGDKGTVTIYGGTITATGGLGAAGIGGQLVATTDGFSSTAVMLRLKEPKAVLVLAME